jgi:hypothetical protein
MGEARKNSVSQLAELYNVVVGIALSIAIYNTIDPKGSPIPLHLDFTLNLLSILILIIPFYHGAMRHLFATYVEGGGSTRIRDVALLGDFVLLFLEGCVFIVIGSLVAVTIKMAWAIAVLLILDSVWGFLATISLFGAQAQNAERIWALINICTAVVLVLLLVFAENVFRLDALASQIGILSVLGLRTVIDYSTSWKFYFPPNI